MKLAFLHKNLKHQSFEEKTILVGHLVTLGFCFFPWFAANPIYEEPFFYNAFSGPGFLIGTFIFVISLLIVLLFLDKLLEKKKVKLPVADYTVYIFASSQSVMLTFLAWSVLSVVRRDFDDADIRYGILFIFVAQVVALVAAILHRQVKKQAQAQSFFQHPTLEKSQESIASDTKKHHSQKHHE